jgi:hypothetical protein
MIGVDGVVLRRGDRIRLNTKMMAVMSKALQAGEDHVVVSDAERIGDEPIGEIRLQVDRGEHVPLAETANEEDPHAR